MYSAGLLGELVLVVAGVAQLNRNIWGSLESVAAD